MKAPSIYLYLAYIGMIMLGGIIYGQFQEQSPAPPHVFEAYPNDYNEYLVECHKTIMQVYQDGQLMYGSFDTSQVIGYIMKDFDPYLGLVVRIGGCAHHDQDSTQAIRSLYQMIEGAPCIENNIAFY